MKFLLVFVLVLASQFATASNCQPDGQETFVTDIPSNISGTNLVPETLKMFYGSIGKIDPLKPVMFVIPGGPGGTYQDVVKAVKDTPILQLTNVVTFDHRGIGCTKTLNPTLPAYYPSLFSMENTAKDIEVIRKDMLKRGLISEKQPWYIFGSSYGGMVAQQYAIDFGHEAEGIIIGSTTIRAKDFRIAANDFLNLILQTKEDVGYFFELIANDLSVRQELVQALFILSYSYHGQMVQVPALLKELSQLKTKEDVRARLYPFRDWSIQEELSAGLVVCENVAPYPFFPYHLGFMSYLDRCKPYKSVAKPFDFTGRLGKIDSRVLLFGGARDHITPIRSLDKIHAEISHSVYWRNDHATHGMRSELPVCFVKVIAAFLSGNDEALKQTISQCQTPPSLEQPHTLTGSMLGLSSHLSAKNSCLVALN